MIADSGGDTARTTVSPVDPVVDAEVKLFASLIAERLAQLLPTVLPPLISSPEVTKALRGALMAPPAPVPPPKRWYSPALAAQVLGTSVRTLEHLRRVGGGPAWVKWGRRGIRYEAGGLEEHMGGQNTT